MNLERCVRFISELFIRSFQDYISNIKEKTSNILSASNSPDSSPFAKLWRSTSFGTAGLGFSFGLLPELAGGMTSHSFYFESINDKTKNQKPKILNRAHWLIIGFQNQLNWQPPIAHIQCWIVPDLFHKSTGTFEIDFCSPGYTIKKILKKCIS